MYHVKFGCENNTWFAKWEHCRDSDKNGKAYFATRDEAVAFKRRFVETHHTWQMNIPL
jgi:hypothetical protein